MIGPAMMPMALGLGEGGPATGTPRSRGVGVCHGTVATLLVLPSCSPIIQGRLIVRSASLDPDDPNSSGVCERDCSSENQTAAGTYDRRNDERKSPHPSFKPTRSSNCS